MLKMTATSLNFVGTDIIDSYFQIEGSNIGNFGKQVANLKIYRINFVG